MTLLDWSMRIDREVRSTADAEALVAEARLDSTLTPEDLQSVGQMAWMTAASFEVVDEEDEDAS